MNKFLIEKISSHQKEAISWRIEKAKEKITLYSPTAHGTDADYHNIAYFNDDIAYPLKSLSDNKYLEKYLELLKLSIKIAKKDAKYVVAADYAWDIVFTYLENIKILRSLAPLEEVKRIIDLEKEISGTDQFNWRYENLRISYLEICKPSDFSASISKYKEIKDKQYVQVADWGDLKNLVIKTINNDLRNWIEEEGAYSIINDYKIISANSSSPNPKALYETFIQKTLKPQLMYLLTCNGLRPNDVKIRREEQLLSDERTDFIISYGFTGDILIEIKLTNNSEVKSPKSRVAYKSKLLKYIDGTHSNFGIFLILQVDQKNHWHELKPKVEKVYNDVSHKVEVIGLNCVAKSA